MTPKEKAIELVDKIYFDIDFDLAGMPNTKIMVSKQCALIEIDEIISDNASVYSQKYWNEVKQEIKKL